MTTDIDEQLDQAAHCAAGLMLDKNGVAALQAWAARKDHEIRRLVGRCIQLESVADELRRRLNEQSAMDEARERHGG